MRYDNGIIIASEANYQNTCAFEFSSRSYTDNELVLIDSYKKNNMLAVIAVLNSIDINDFIKICELKCENRDIVEYLK